MEREPFDDFLRRHAAGYVSDYWTIYGTMHLAIAGVRLLDGVKSVPSLNAAISESFPDISTELRMFEEGSIGDLPFALAYREVMEDFPVIHSQGLVALWGGLESFVEDFMVDWLLKFPQVLNDKSWGDVKVSLALYMNLEAESRMRLLLKETAQKIAADAKPGVGGFEELLGRCRITGSVDSELRKCLLTCSELRNVIVHRRGVADARIVSRCAWLGLSEGRRIKIGSEDIEAYFEGCREYVEGIMNRAAAANPDRADGSANGA